MKSKVFTVEQHDLIDRVFFLIHYEKVRHIPVVEKGKVIAIVSDRDLYKALGLKTTLTQLKPLLAKACRTACCSTKSSTYHASACIDR